MNVPVVSRAASETLQGQPTTNGPWKITSKTHPKAYAIRSLDALSETAAVELFLPDLRPAAVREASVRHYQSLRGVTSPIRVRIASMTRSHTASFRRRSFNNNPVILRMIRSS